MVYNRPFNSIRFFFKRLLGSSISPPTKYALGCGSNVVDHIYYVRAMPKLGNKGFFKSPFKTLESRLLGGVTLNHLSWAALAGVPTGLLAIQGEDESGQLIRSGLEDLGVSSEFIKVDPLYRTGECHVFIEENGERTILMAKGASSLINAEMVTRNFKPIIQEKAVIVSTEVSQIPLTGVKAILESARESNVLGILDLDVSPSVCVEEAELGTFEELIECIKLCDVLKPAKGAITELLSRYDPSSSSSWSLEEIATRSIQLFGCQLTAITAGEGDTVLATRDHVVSVSPPPVSRIVDTTGAGDAFLGGLITGLKAKGVPSSPESLRWLGSLANGFGATCVQYVGGVPGEGARETLESYIKDLYDVPSVSFSTSPDYKASMSNDIEALKAAMEVLSDSDVNSFFKILTSCAGQIITSGIGKSGIIASRLASSLSSIGITSQYVHSTEWVHGDLGKVTPGKDVVVFFSHSGNTAEAVLAAHHLISNGTCTLVVTSRTDSELSRLTTAQFVYGCKELPEPFGVLPTISLVIQEAVCNAIVNELIKRKRITKEVFKKNHPGGSIGQKLSTP